MFPTKRVLVIYPDEYEELAFVLQHKLSKLDAFDAAAWTVDHYKQNLPTLSARTNVIFLGGSEENRYSKIYLSQIKNIVNKCGACFGRDGSKAVVYGEGSLEQLKAFNAHSRVINWGGVNISPDFGRNFGEAVGLDFIIAIPIDMIKEIKKTFILGIFEYYYQKKSLIKELRYEQTKLAIYNFLKTELDLWLKDGA